MIAIRQARQAKEDPAKIGLLWTAEWLLKLRRQEQMRQFFEHVLTNPLLIPIFPDYLNGFILSLTFAPRIARFVVELLSKVFASVPSNILMPWLPSLILRLRPHQQILQSLIKEASHSYPNSLSALDEWKFPWQKEIPAPSERQEGGKHKTFPQLSQTELTIRSLLFTMPATTNALAPLLSPPNVGGEGAFRGRFFAPLTEGGATLTLLTCDGLLSRLKAYFI